jgi:hypothetical protein
MDPPVDAVEASWSPVDGANSHARRATAYLQGTTLGQQEKGHVEHAP